MSNTCTSHFQVSCSQFMNVISFLFMFFPLVLNILYSDVMLCKYQAHWYVQCKSASKGSGTILKVGGGGRLWKSKMARQCPPSCLCNAGGVWGDVLRSWSFFENVVLDEAIWCTIFHHVKHVTASLLGSVFYFRTGRSKKWRGHSPQQSRN